MMKKILAILLAAMMIVALTACGKSSEKENTNNSDAPAEAAEEQQEEKDYFPREEKEELSVWVPWSANTVSEISEVWVVKEMEARTNVHVEYFTVGAQEAQEQFGLMLASGKYQDILAGGYYPTGVSGGLQDGVLMDVTDLVPQYMPRYMEILNANPEYDKMTKLDDGKRVAIYQINCYNNERMEGENPWIGTAIRKDWLDDLGLEKPVTIEDWHNVLTAFKDNYGACMALNAQGVNYSGDFLTAFGVLGGMYQDNGTVHFGPAEEGYKEYLKTMHQWYEEGLIDQNFTSFSEWSDPNAKFATEEIGAGPIIGSNAGTILKGQGYTEDEDFYLDTVAPAVLNAGDASQYGMDIPVCSRSVTLSTKCRNPELALRYIDLFFDPEISEINFYGKEGESFTKNENGEYEFTDVIRHDPNGVAASDKIAEYTLKAGEYFGFYNWAYAVPLVKTDNPDDPDLNALQGTWKVNVDLCMPTNMTMTPEETAEYYSYFTDIQTMAAEYTVKAIMGEEDIEQFDTFVASMKNVGLDRCVGIQQNALGR